jgi:hypothetical protein
MALFGLYTFRRRPGAASVTPGSPFPPGARGLAIEVINDGEEYGVLFSTVDDPENPGELVCGIGFSNGSRANTIWGDRGFPLVDAVISVEDGNLAVMAPSFSEESAMDYHAELITIRGLDLNGASAASRPLNIRHRQPLYTPDTAQTATSLRTRRATWRPARLSGTAAQARPQFEINTLRLPSLTPFRNSDAEGVGQWVGHFDPPSRDPLSPVSAQAIPRETIFGAPAFRFQDVELLGFRIDLDRFGVRNEHLDSLTDRLNFHLLEEDPRLVSDFSYRPATRTILLELLRYGKMKLKENEPPLDNEDFQSQHELLVQMLVGRVDDDTAQARDPAVYVPAIFVDNPWSRNLGRGALGYDKRMADFCVSVNNSWTALQPDGRLAPDREPEPLGSVGRIELSTGAGGGQNRHPLLGLDCPYQDDGWDNFLEIDLGLVLGTSPFSPARWRKSDFGATEFRRSFANSSFVKDLLGFRSIQVSPVGESSLLREWADETSWVTSSFSLNNPLEVAIPFGTAGLTFHAEPSAPKSWKTLCEILGIGEGRSRTIGISTGNCYRMRFSMDLTIDNGLD